MSKQKLDSNMVNALARRCLAEARYDHAEALWRASRNTRSGALWHAVVHAIYALVEERKGATQTPSAA